jgi:hypothetical protein
MLLSREGVLQRFGSDILDRLAVEKAIPRKESWGEWIMTEEVGRCLLGNAPQLVPLQTSLSIGSLTHPAANRIS